MLLSSLTHLHVLREDLEIFWCLNALQLKSSALYSKEPNASNICVKYTKAKSYFFSTQIHFILFEWFKASKLWSSHVYGVIIHQLRTKTIFSTILKIINQFIKQFIAIKYNMHKMMLYWLFWAKCWFSKLEAIAFKQNLCHDTAAKYTTRYTTRHSNCISYHQKICRFIKSKLITLYHLWLKTVYKLENSL